MNEVKIISIIIAVITLVLFLIDVFRGGPSVRGAGLFLIGYGNLIYQYIREN